MIEISPLVKVDTHEESSPYNKSRGEVPSCELPFIIQNLVEATERWSLRLVPRIQTSLTCDLFLKRLVVNCSWDKSLRLVPSCKLFSGLVMLLIAWTSSLVSADFYECLISRHAIFIFLIGNNTN